VPILQWYVYMDLFLYFYMYGGFTISKSGSGWG
jgi:hypothetical protein